MGTVPPPIRETLDRTLAALREAFGERLRSVALFGSQARGEALPDSDIDLVLVLAANEGDDYARLSDAFRRSDLDRGPFLSVVIWSSEQLAGHPWLLIDVAVDGAIIVDDDGGLARAMDDVRRRLHALGARRVPLENGTWYWDLKPGWKPGDVIEI